MELEREDLLSVLTDAAPAIARSPTIPELSHFWFDCKHIYAYDGGLGIRLAYKSELDCGVPGRPLLDLLKTSALKTVFLDQVKTSLVIQMGKSKVNLVSLGNDRRPVWNDPAGSPRRSFPVAPPKKDDDALVLSERIIEALNQVLFVRASRPTRSVHHGVIVAPTKSAIELYTTDELTLAQAVVAERPPAGLAAFIMPWAFVERVLNLIEPGAALHVLDDCLVIESKGIMLASNLLELPDAPDLPKTLASYLKSVPDAAALPNTLMPILDRAAILAGAEEASLTLTTKGKTLICQGKYKLGSLNEQLELKSPLPETSARFSAKLIGRGLGKADAFTLSKNALVLYGGEDFVYVVSSTS